ncbi:MAG: hypothetical protein ACREBE_02665 [bacterium]
MAGDDSICDGVGMTLVGVASGADAALQVDTSALLNHMRGFVRHGVEVGTASEHDVIACRVCLGTHGVRGRGGLGAGVSLDG